MSCCWLTFSYIVKYVQGMGLAQKPYLKVDDRNTAYVELRVPACSAQAHVSMQDAVCFITRL